MGGTWENRRAWLVGWPSVGLVRMVSGLGLSSGLEWSGRLGGEGRREGMEWGGREKKKKKIHGSQCMDELMYQPFTFVLSSNPPDLSITVGIS